MIDAQPVVPRERFQPLPQQGCGALADVEARAQRALIERHDADVQVPHAPWRAGDGEEAEAAAGCPIDRGLGFVGVLVRFAEMGGQSADFGRELREHPVCDAVAQPSHVVLDVFGRDALFRQRYVPGCVSEYRTTCSFQINCSWAPHPCQQTAILSWRARMPRRDYRPQTSLRTRIQFAPRTLRMRGSDQLRLSMAAVRFGISPMVRIPSGFTTSPKSVSLRAYPLSCVIQSKNAAPYPWVWSVPMPTWSSPAMSMQYSIAST